MKAGFSVPSLKVSAFREVSVLSQSPPISTTVQVYMRRISSPVSSAPDAAVTSEKPLSVNQSLSVPIQPDMLPPSLWERPSMEEM